MAYFPRFVSFFPFFLWFCFLLFSPVDDVDPGAEMQASAGKGKETTTGGKQTRLRKEKAKQQAKQQRKESTKQMSIWSITNESALPCSTSGGFKHAMLSGVLLLPSPTLPRLMCLSRKLTLEGNLVRRRDGPMQGQSRLQDVLGSAVTDTGRKYGRQQAEGPAL